MNRLLWFLFFMAVMTTAYSQDHSLYQKWWLIQNGDTMPYRLLLPKDYDVSKQYPLVVFLHGRGESGRDNETQLVHGASLFLRDSIRNRYPAFVLFPQCAADSYWSNVVTIKDSTGKRNFYFIENGQPSEAMELLLHLVDYIFQAYPINKEQVYVMGLSMGGMGTYELVRRKPGTFAAAVAICGGAHPATAKELSKTAWWLFHGLKDDVVNPRFTQQMEGGAKNPGCFRKSNVLSQCQSQQLGQCICRTGFTAMVILP